MGLYCVEDGAGEDNKISTGGGAAVLLVVYLVLVYLLVRFSGLGGGLVRDIREQRVADRGLAAGGKLLRFKVRGCGFTGNA